MLDETGLRAAAGSRYTAIRAGAAAHPDLPPDLVPVLTADRARAVRLALSLRPGLTEQQRARIPLRVRTSEVLPAATWAALPDRVRASAASAHVGLRRAAARSAYLPPDAVPVLAADPDPVVRLLLCENHAGVPVDVTVAAFLDCSSISQYELTRTPWFPRSGLAYLIDHPDPAARALAARDPDLSGAALEVLLGAVEPVIRKAAAAHPSLAPARIRELLDDPGTAFGAAANPSLEPAEMRRILDA
jgi:hypothetical protein